MGMWHRRLLPRRAVGRWGFPVIEQQQRHGTKCGEREQWQQLHAKSRGRALLGLFLLVFVERAQPLVDVWRSHIAGEQDGNIIRACCAFSARARGRLSVAKVVGYVAVIFGGLRAKIITDSVDVSTVRAGVGWPLRSGAETLH